RCAADALPLLVRRGPLRARHRGAEAVPQRVGRQAPDLARAPPARLGEPWGRRLPLRGLGPSAGEDRKGPRPTELRDRLEGAAWLTTTRPTRRPTTRPPSRACATPTTTSSSWWARSASGPSGSARATAASLRPPASVRWPTTGAT